MLEAAGTAEGDAPTQPDYAGAEGMTPGMLMQGMINVQLPNERAQDGQPAETGRQEAIGEAAAGGLATSPPQVQLALPGGSPEAGRAWAGPVAAFDGQGGFVQSTARNLERLGSSSAVNAVVQGVAGAMRAATSLAGQGLQRAGQEIEAMVTSGAMAVQMAGLGMMPGQQVHYPTQHPTSPSETDSWIQPAMPVRAVAAPLQYYEAPHITAARQGLDPFL